VTRYRAAFAWSRGIDEWLRHTVTEAPLLHVCSGSSRFGDVTADLYEPADLRASWVNMPFERDSFGAVFADPPWGATYKKEVAEFVREALRIAPVAYLMSPWIYCAEWVDVTDVWWREHPGVNAPILLSRYERMAQLALLPDEVALSQVGA